MIEILSVICIGFNGAENFEFFIEYTQGDKSGVEIVELHVIVINIIFL